MNTKIRRQDDGCRGEMVSKDWAGINLGNRHKDTGDAIIELDHLGSAGVIRPRMYRLAPASAHTSREKQREKENESKEEKERERRRKRRRRKE